MSYYYDSCVFCNSLNPEFGGHADCLRVTTPVNITWQVSICPDLIKSETTIGEFISAFEIDCALNGVSLSCINATQVSDRAKALVKHKKPLSQLGLQNIDWKHAVAATIWPCKYLVSTDQDFRDPANKSVSNGTGARVKKYLAKHLALDVVWPCDVKG